MKIISKTGTCATAALFVLLSAGQALADTDAIRTSDNSIWFSAGTSLLNYKEPNVANGTQTISDSEHGWAPSFNVGASMLGSPTARGFARNIYVAFNTTITAGDADYDGYNIASFPATPLKGTTNETIWSIDGKIGRGFEVGRNAMLIPYGQLGYRHWERELSSTQSETYAHFEVLGGLMGQYAPTNRLVFSAYGAAGTTFASEMETGGHTYDLGSKAVYKTGAKAAIFVNPKLELFSTIDYNYFEYGRSEVYNSMYEPSSFTGETAIRFGIGYHFGSNGRSPGSQESNFVVAPLR